MITMDDAQNRPNESPWKCYICGKQMNDMQLKPCIYKPRMIASFDPHPFITHILTTVCKRCSNDERYKYEN